MIDSILSQLSLTAVYIVIVVLAITFILCLIKKEIKIAILLIATMFMVILVGYSAVNLQNNVNFSVVDGVGRLNIRGKSINLDKDIIEKMIVESRGVVGSTLTIKNKDGIGEIDIPTFLVSPLVQFAEENDIEVEIVY